MISKNNVQKNSQAPSPLIALGLSLALGLALLIVSLNQLSVARASGLDNALAQDEQRVVGLASNALECLVAGSDLQGNASGTVWLTWSGRAARARLIMRVSGAEAAHTIKVNGQPVATAPIHPAGQTCRNGESFYLDIPPEVLVQGENHIEMTNDALPGDNWTAAQVRLEVLGDFPALAAENNTLAAQAPAAVNASTIEFTNPYDGSNQEARVAYSSSYTGHPTPLVIYVHGRSVDMYRGEELYGEAIEAKDWLLVSPQLHGSWPYPPDPPGKYAYASLESQYDVIGALNYMLTNYNVITDQIYLVGYSMGGQADTVIAAKFPHVFAAVLDNKGPSDMYQWYYENTTFHRTWMERECHINEVLQTPPQNPFCYQRRSGINFASNYIHVPLSVTHSVSDALVPIYHSRDLRDAINSYTPDWPVSVYEDNLVGPTCPPDHHCYEPDPMAVLNFFEQFTLNNEPTHINVATDESKSYYWLNVVQTGGDHWSQIKVNYYPISATVRASITDTAELTLAFNLGSTYLASTNINPQLKQPGMELPATTYLVKGGGNNDLYDYSSGYLSTSLSTLGQFTLTISAIQAELAANPLIVSGQQTNTSTITATVQDYLGNSAPDGAIIEFSATEGTFANASSTYTTTLTGGQSAVALTLGPADDLAKVTAHVHSVSGSVTVDVIHPAIQLLSAPDAPIIYNGDAVTYTYQLLNNGDTTLTHLTLVDDNGTPGDSADDLTLCDNVSLAAGATTSYNRSATLTQTTTSRAAVSGQDPLGYAVSDSDLNTVNVISPALDLLIVPRQIIAYRGESLTLTYQITNSGDTTLTAVTVSDDSGTACENITLAAGEAQDCTQSLIISQTSTITAIGAGQDMFGQSVNHSDSITISAISPAVNLLVTLHQAAIYYGETVTYTYQINNIGDATLSNVSVSDNNGTICENITLAAGATTSCSYHETLTQTTINTATVTGQDPLGYDVTDIDSVIVNVISPAIEVKITPHQTTVHANEMLTYTYQLTNTGDAVLTNVTLVDDSGPVCQGITLTAGATENCSRSTTLSQDTTITVTATGQDLLGNAVTDSDSTNISVIAPALDLLITPQELTIYGEELLTFTYQFTNTGDTTLTAVTVSDDNGTICEDIVLAAGEAQSCTQSLTISQTTTLTTAVTGQDPLNRAVNDSETTTIVVKLLNLKVYLPVVTRND